MPNYYEGKLLGEGLSFGIIISRFNEFITNKLLSGALDMLKRHGVSDDAIDVAWVPGAFELPMTAQQMVERSYDGVICLGAVIRGATPHFDYVASEATKGIAQVGLAAKKPVVYGLITADTLEQAIERAGTKAGNKGADAAVTVLEMVNLFKELKGKK